MPYRCRLHATSAQAPACTSAAGGMECGTAGARGAAGRARGAARAGRLRRAPALPGHSRGRPARARRRCSACARRPGSGAARARRIHCASARAPSPPSLQFFFPWCEHVTLSAGWPVDCFALCPRAATGVRRPSYPQADLQACGAPQVRAAAPDVFAELGPLEPGLASPCFRGAAGARRCLPAFAIIGVSKCGTTDLYRKLLALPSVHAAANKAGALGQLKQLLIMIPIKSHRCMLCTSDYPVASSACQRHARCRDVLCTGAQAAAQHRSALTARQRRSRQGPHFWDEAKSFGAYLDNFDGVAAATAAHPRAVAGDASSNTFSYAVVGLRHAAHSKVTQCRHRAEQSTTKPVHPSLLWLCSPENTAGACPTRTAPPHSP